MFLQRYNYAYYIIQNIVLPTFSGTHNKFITTVDRSDDAE